MSSRCCGHSTHKRAGLNVRISAHFQHNFCCTRHPLNKGYWNSSDPGDHIRVLAMAPVPQPQTYALMLAGLGAVGLATRRRKAVPRQS